MRGHHAYKDIFKPAIGTTLTLQREPENANDPHAVAIVEDTGRIVGHSPLVFFFKRLTTRQQQKSVENGSIEDLAWIWNFQLFMRLTAEGNISTDWMNLFKATRLQRGPQKKKMIDEQKRRIIHHH